MSVFKGKSKEKTESLSKRDLPYVIGMVVLDIAAPILLMLGISCGSSSNASLIGNFEIVATTVIAFFVFFSGNRLYRSRTCAGLRCVRSEHYPLC